MKPEFQTLISLSQDVISLAQKKGADVAEVTARSGNHLSAQVRLLKPELIEEAGSKSLGLRVMKGEKSAVTYTSDTSVHGLQRLVRDAIELVDLAAPDPYAQPPDVADLSTAEQHPQLELFDPHIVGLDAKSCLERALQGEKAALDVDARLRWSEGGSFSSSWGYAVLCTSQGFTGAQDGTNASVVVRPVVDDNNGKKRAGFYWSSKRHLTDLQDAKEVGIEAARRTLAKLGARKVPTQEVPVVFDPDAARALVGAFAGCIGGYSIWRRSSYLVDRQDSRVASELVSFVDDPTLLRGPGSRAFDGEGLLARKNQVVDNGILKTYLLDTYSARKLNKKSTASASRGSSGGVGVSTSNFLLLPGTQSPAELIASTPKGFYVTEMMGHGFNAVTGDFSRGASGFWIEGGELTFPVSEVTISLNFNDLWQRVDAVANNLELRTSIASPTFRVSAMTLAGT